MTMKAMKLGNEVFNLKRRILNSIIKQTGSSVFLFQENSLINVASNNTEMALKNIHDGIVTMIDIHNTKEALTLRLDEFMIEELADIAIGMGITDC